MSSNTPSSILIAAAGTGGHVMPALSVAEYLHARGTAIHWVGTTTGLEYHWVAHSDYYFHTFIIQGIRGQKTARLIKTPLMLMRATYQALKLLRQVQPSCVLTMGGYISAPVGLAAYLTGTPLIIHEQNAVPGLTNKLLKPMAQHILQAFPRTFSSHRRLATVGNPIREDILAVSPPQIRFNSRHGQLRVLVFGGSQGSQFLNEVLPAAVSQIPDDCQPVIWHQAGEKQLTHAQYQYQQYGIEADIVPFINDMPHAYEWADIVISRCGALTVSEIAAVGAASILIPYPYSKDDHQFKNANHLTQHQAAYCFRQHLLSSATLAETLEHLHRSRQQLRSMAETAQDIGIRDATQRLTWYCNHYLQVNHDVT